MVCKYGLVALWWVKMSVACPVKGARGRNATKLVGVGPVDNRPSTDQLHHFVQQEKFPYSAKIAITFEPVLQFLCPSRLKLSSSQFYGLKHHFQLLGSGRVVKIFSQAMSNKGVCRKALPTPGLLTTFKKIEECTSMTKIDLFP